MLSLCLSLVVLFLSTDIIQAAPFTESDSGASEKWISDAGFRPSVEQIGSPRIRDQRRQVQETLYSCAVPCSDIEFCGSDLTCHSFSCENIYLYAPAEYTTGSNLGVASLDDLTCYDIADPSEEDLEYLGIGGAACLSGLPSAVVYACDGFPSLCAEDATTQLPRVRMNRKCVAQPFPTTGFVCYDISPSTNLEEYFAPYIAEVSSIENNTCPGDANATLSHVYSSELIVKRTYTDSGPPPSDVVEISNYFFDENLKTSMIFNISVASAVSVYAYLFNTSQYTNEFLCDPGCKATTQFCGRDLKCYDLGCENYYAYGPEQWTGNDGTGAAGDLTCVDTVSKEAQCVYDTIDLNNTWPPAIRYRCLEVGTVFSPNKCSLGEEDEYYAPMNRYCSAKPNATTSFQCFDIAPETNTTEYLQEYFSAIAANPNCNVTQASVTREDDYLGEVFGFNEIVGCARVSSSNSESINCLLGSGQHSRYAQFDPTWVKNAMAATLVITDNPTAGPANTESSEAGSLCSGGIYAGISSIIALLAILASEGFSLD